MSFNIEVEGGKSVRLSTAGKYCDRDIVVTATGGGGAGSYDEGYEAGAKSEYDRMWDMLQKGGTQTDYMRLFRGIHWSASNFYPKYDICPAGNAAEMFYAWTMLDEYTREMLDLAQRLEDCGVVLDTSKATNLTSAFAYGYRYTRLPTIDLTSCTSSGSTANMMSGCNNVVTLDKVIVAEDTTYNSTFHNMTRLENIIFEGVIGQNGLHLAWSGKLTHDSLMSVINCLQTKASGTWTLTLGATNLAKLTDAEKAIATEKGWTLA